MDLPKAGLKTEMIGRIYSHVLHKSVLGFKGLFNQTANGIMELSVTEKIWVLILQIVAAITNLFSTDKEEIIQMIANDNEKIANIKKLCSEKRTA